MTKARPHRSLGSQADIQEFEIEDDPKLGARRRPRTERSVLFLFVGLLSGVCFFVVGVLFYTNTGGSSKEATPAAPTGLAKDFNAQQNWGAYSPYFDSGVPFTGIASDALDGEYTLPYGFSYKQVHVLHRHGDRFPAPGTTELMVKVANKIQTMTKPPTDESFRWITEWNYTLGADTLVSKGVANMYDSGARFWGSHGRLLYGEPAAPFWKDDLNVYANGSSRPKPVLRATDQFRIQDSARAWAAGFFNTLGRPGAGGNPEDHYTLVLQAEAEHSNSSLAPEYGCPNVEAKGAQLGKEYKKEWYHVYLEDAATRLQELLPGYDNMTTKDVLGLQDMCVFETAAYGQSAFCQLFTVNEWRGFEYHIDLKFFGDCGWGSSKAIGPATGFPWLTELLARFKKQYITEATNGVNTTLASSAETFPLDQPFYLDLTHDTTIYGVLSALQFSWLKESLPTNKIKVPRQNIISRLTPFGARLYVEVLDGPDGEYVRLKLNDRVLPLQDLKHCPQDPTGLCPKKSFIKQLEWSLDQIDFEDICYGEHDFTA